MRVRTGGLVPSLTSEEGLKGGRGLVVAAVVFKTAEFSADVLGANC